jgi:hypothetical protein
MVAIKTFHICHKLSRVVSLGIPGQVPQNQDCPGKTGTSGHPNMGLLLCIKIRNDARERRQPVDYYTADFEPEEYAFNAIGCNVIVVCRSPLYTFVGLSHSYVHGPALHDKEYHKSGNTICQILEAGRNNELGKWTFHWTLPITRAMPVRLT